MCKILRWLYYLLSLWTLKYYHDDIEDKKSVSKDLHRFCIFIHFILQIKQYSSIEL